MTTLPPFGNGVVVAPAMLRLWAPSARAHAAIITVANIALWNVNFIFHLMSGSVAGFFPNFEYPILAVRRGTLRLW